MAEHKACLLLGSNVQPEKNLNLGLDLLRLKVDVFSWSSIWETPPVGSTGPHYLNMAVLITTLLDAAGLKGKILRPLEAQLGRKRSANKNAPRPIDFDIITFDGRLIDTSLWKYAHRAVPVAEILPDLRSDDGESLTEIASRFIETHPIQKRRKAHATGTVTDTRYNP
jgi:2-amino-4-hydroxy-6-hydroxymethyldihydropteridine diphosphokinase